MTRKQVRNFNLRVRADGSVHMSMPQRATLKAAQDMLDRHAAWVEKRVGRIQAHKERPTRGVLETGAVALWGRRAPLQVTTDESLRYGSVRLLSGAEAQAARMTEGGWRDALPEKPFAVILIALPGALDAAEREKTARSLIDKVYRAEIERVLPQVASAYESALGVHAERWSLRRMKTRWGSCTPKTRSIRLNVQLAAYPPYCLGYVVAHELVHLREASHNARFHALLNGCCSAAVKARKRLRQPPLADEEPTP